MRNLDLLEYYEHQPSKLETILLINQIISRRLPLITSLLKKLRIFTKLFRLGLSFTNSKPYSKKHLIYSPKITTFTTYETSKLFHLAAPNNPINLPSNNNGKLFSLFKVFFTTFGTYNLLSLDKNFGLKFSFFSSCRSTAVFSLNKIFLAWKNFYSLIFNLFFYEVRCITFTNSFFSKDILSLNWSFLDKTPIILNIWRYLKPFLFLNSNPIIYYSNVLFKKLRLSGVSVAIVTDTLYHSKTLYYLSINRFFTIGLFTPNSYSKLVDFYLLSLGEGLYSQLFFIRYIVFLRKNSRKHKFLGTYNRWSYLLNTFNN